MEVFIYTFHFWIVNSCLLELFHLPEIIICFNTFDFKWRRTKNTWYHMQFQPSILKKRIMKSFRQVCICKKETRIFNSGDRNCYWMIFCMIYHYWGYGKFFKLWKNIAEFLKGKKRPRKCLRIRQLDRVCSIENNSKYLQFLIETIKSVIQNNCF